MKKKKERKKWPLSQKCQNLSAHYRTRHTGRWAPEGWVGGLPFISIKMRDDPDCRRPYFAIRCEHRFNKWGQMNCGRLAPDCFFQTAKQMFLDLKIFFKGSMRTNLCLPLIKKHVPHLFIIMFCVSADLAFLHVHSRRLVKEDLWCFGSLYLISCPSRTVTHVYRH